MKVVSVVWFKVFPPKFGGQKGIALFHKYLSAHCSITCICSKDNVIEASAPFTTLPRLPISKLQFLDIRVWRKIVNVVRDERAGIVLLEHPYHIFAALRAKKNYGAKLVLHQHNIEFLRFRELKRWWWPLLKRMEALACRNADLILFKTETDRQIAVSLFGLNAQQLMVLPYGIEKANPNQNAASYLQWKHGINEGEPILVFAGTLDYEPNANGVEAIYQQLAPELEAAGVRCTILICGRNKFEKFQYLKTFQHPNVIMVGEVEDIAPYLQGADVMINPVVTGGGIQTKILDALAMHCNVVAFQKAWTGIDTGIAGEKAWIVDNGNWKEMVAAIRQAIPVKKETPQAFFDKYSWEVIAANAAKAMQNIYPSSIAR